MDGSRFDNLARALAGSTSRRSVLRGLAGLAGGLVGLGGAGALAQTCRPAGRSCTSNGNCCSGLCDTANPDPFKRNKCACPPGYEIVRGDCKNPATDYKGDVDNCGSAGNRCPIDQCNQATCTNGVCGLAPNPLRVGKSCTTADLCAVAAVCQADGACRGAAKDCSALNDQCGIGVCNPATGACVKQPKPNGTSCDDGNLCTQTDTCQNGQCVGGNPVVCAALDQCHVPGVCDPATGVCSNPNNADGIACDDDNACTTGDTCRTGVCTGGSPVTCTTAEPCLEAYCDQTSGCRTRPKAAGTACGDGNACNGAEVCNAAGECVPGTPVSCGACLRCNAANGSCEPDPGQLGQSCTPSGQPDRCFGGYQCNASGVCAGVNPVVCTAKDQCHIVGTCNPSTGVCSNPDKANGTTCDDGNPATVGDVCTNGVCGGVDRCANVTCTPQDDCHLAGVCNLATGTCSNPVAPDGTACDDGNPATENDVCTAGVCAGTAVSTCRAGMGPCIGQDHGSCGAAGQHCYCHTTLGGSPICVAPSGGCFYCANDADCGGGGGDWACVQSPCCGDVGTFCVRRCAEADACAGVVCPAPEPCHGAGTCNPSSGTCGYPRLPDGTSCSDGTPATAGLVCRSGVCGADPCAGVDCTARDRCHADGTCNPSTGVCSTPALPDGTSCSDGTPGTAGHVCTNGACGPG